MVKVIVSNFTKMEEVVVGRRCKSFYLADVMVIISGSVQATKVMGFNLERCGRK